MTTSPPATRRLRILSFDPSLTARLETSRINEITVEVPWEAKLDPGPVGEYIEVVDVDPASNCAYLPVDLNDPFLLAQDGLAPSESNPQFHQQMVYAVAMNTIRQFERALGRAALWSARRIRQPNGAFHEQFVRRLRIYPHALRERNAYYSPEHKALLFGYFPVTHRDADNTPGTLVFTALSHGIVAHETTHALLDGVHPRFAEPTNPDVAAFHEAFADLVAVFLHFTYPHVLESQIQRTRGDLETENLLAQLAQQFGQATGRGSALRDALGEDDPETGEWKSRKPDHTALDRAFEPHDRGAILVAAVFKAFLRIYRARAADLYRIATQGTGTLPEGDIHPDLTKRLAAEAAWAADRVLQMCIRAIDYCPPVDITFGDFLRGLITADLDYAPDDKSGFRVVFIESFREWGIYPDGVRSLGIEALTWPSGQDLMDDDPDTYRALDRPPTEEMERFLIDASRIWSLGSDRFAVWSQLDELRRDLRRWLQQGNTLNRTYARLFGLVTGEDDPPPSVFRGAGGEPTVEVHSVRPALRRTLDGGLRTDLVLEMTQRRRGWFDAEEQRAARYPGEHRPDRIRLHLSRGLHRPDRSDQSHRPAGDPHPRRRCQRRRLGTDAPLSDRRRHVGRRNGHGRDHRRCLFCRGRPRPVGVGPGTGAVRVAASRWRGGSLMATLVPPDDGVVVRMYRIGHGDCFLLAFPRDGDPQPPCPEAQGNGAAAPDDAPVYVLIDCGNKPGSETTEFLHGHAIETVVAHMREACGDRLDLAIATHEHQDHLNGIWRTEDPPFGDLSIARTWVAWTEDPDDELANKLRRDHDDTLLELVAARNKLATAFDVEHPDVQQLDLLLGLDGHREESQRPPVFAARTPIEKDIEKQGLKLLKDRAREHDGVCFLRPDKPPMMLPGTNVKVYVLGPPRSEKLIRSADPHKKEGFPEDGPHPFSLGEAALAEQGGESPFARRYGLPLDEAHAGGHPFFVQHYGDGNDGETEEDGVETPDNAPFRRIDADWLSAATDLAICDVRRHQQHQPGARLRAPAHAQGAALRGGCPAGQLGLLGRSNPGPSMGRR